MQSKNEKKLPVLMLAAFGAMAWCGGLVAGESLLPAAWAEDYECPYPSYCGEQKTTCSVSTCNCCPKGNGEWECQNFGCYDPVPVF